MIRPSSLIHADAVCSALLIELEQEKQEKQEPTSRTELLTGLSDAADCGNGAPAPPPIGLIIQHRRVKSAEEKEKFSQRP